MNLWYKNQAPGSDWAWLSIAIIISYQPIDVYSACRSPFATKEATSHHPRAYCHRRPYLAHHPAWCQLDPCHLSTKAITLLVQFSRDDSEVAWSFPSMLHWKQWGQLFYPPKKCHMSSKIWSRYWDSATSQLPSNQSPLWDQMKREAEERAHYVVWTCAAARVAPNHPMSILSWETQWSKSIHSAPVPKQPQTYGVCRWLHAAKRYPFWGSRSNANSAKDRKCVWPMPSALISASTTSNFISAFGIVKAKSPTWIGRKKKLTTHYIPW